MHAARLLLMHCLCTLREKGVTVGPEDYKLTSKLDLAGMTLPFILAQIIINIIFFGTRVASSFSHICLEVSKQRIETERMN